MQKRGFQKYVEIYQPVMRAMHAILGEYSEFILHDLSMPESSVTAVCGNVTERHIGAPTTNLVMETLRKYGDQAEDILCYPSTTKDGRQLKSMTTFIREQGKIVGCLCCNVDLTEYIMAQKLLCGFCKTRLPAEAEPKKEEAKENTEGTETEAAATEEETAMEASVYEDIRKKLIAKGIPPQEIAFIHDANTETQKAELFAKVRNGQVRVLLGSTQKMGAGTNVQTKLVASHDLDCPWRPADLEQRAGRIVRRGNENDHVKIYRYVTKGTFDAYTWGLVESKQKFIGQIMTSKSPARSIEDVDATALSYAEVKMLATGDQRIKEKMDLDIQVTKLKMLKSNHTAQQYEMQDKVRGYYPNKIKETELLIDCLKADLPLLEAHPVKEDAFNMEVMGTVYTDRKEAGQAIVAACRLMDDPDRDVELGSYRGFPMKLSFDGTKFKVTMKQHLTHTAELSSDVVGNITRINNALEKIPQSLKNHQENLERLHTELESAKEEAERPFPQEEELAEKSARLAELNTVLDNEEKGRGSGKETPEEEPRREESETPERAAGKPSILKSLKEYERPTPVISGREKSQEREVI